MTLGESIKQLNLSHFFFFKIFYDAANGKGKIMASTNYKEKYVAVSKRKMGLVTTEQWF